MTEPLTFTLPPEVIEQLVETIVGKVLDQLGERESANGWPAWLDVKTAARYLGCELGAVRKLYERRKVPHYQDGLGAKVWLRRSELDAYMESARHEARLDRYREGRA